MMTQREMDRDPDEDPRKTVEEEDEAEVGEKVELELRLNKELKEDMIKEYGKPEKVDEDGEFMYDKYEFMLHFHCCL